mmetsp:Transcript_68895/g.162131  ORF Transcript_68895/g.162131 Transcript_68895/m.162131 type:complete len:228 (-) Transcript_68895:42-725(-)
MWSVAWLNRHGLTHRLLSECGRGQSRYIWQRANITWRQHTPLHLSALRGYTEMCQMLIDAGANIHAGNEHGVTPLHTTAAEGRVELSQILIKATINSALGVEAVDDKGCTPLHMSALFGHVAVSRMLLKAGANIDATESHLGSTPLHVAAAEGYVETCRMLVEAGANVHATDHEGLTPLDRAKRFARFAHSGGVVELLQQATAVEEVDAGSAKQPKKTPKKKPDKDS